VRVKDSQRLGPVDDGWRVALVNPHERAPGCRWRSGCRLLDYPAACARAADRNGGRPLADPSFREKLADWFVQSEGLKNTRMRTMTAPSRAGQAPGPESSIAKINRPPTNCKISATQQSRCRISTASSAIPPWRRWRRAFQSSLLSSAGLRIAGGTDEILKNIIAERVLGLPGDIRVDKDVAFKVLPGRSVDP